MQAGVWIGVAAAFLAAGGAIYCVVTLRSARASLDELHGRLHELEQRHASHLASVEHELRQLRIGMVSPLTRSPREGTERAVGVEQIEHYLQQGAAWVGHQVSGSSWQALRASLERLFTKRG